MAGMREAVQAAGQQRQRCGHRWCHEAAGAQFAPDAAPALSSPVVTHQGKSCPPNTTLPHLPTSASHAAVGSMSTNPRNTISQLKRLMGKKFNDPHVRPRCHRTVLPPVKEPPLCQVCCRFYRCCCAPISWLTLCRWRSHLSVARRFRRTWSTSPLRCLPAPTGSACTT